MDIKIIRVDGAIKVTPAPPYIIEYLQYTHRAFALQGYKKVNSYEKRLLYTVSDEGGVITFQGFFDKLTKLIHKNRDNLIVEDVRTALPQIDLKAIRDINWKSIGSSGLRDYQYSPMLEFLQKAQQDSGIVNATGGWGKTVAQAVTYAAFSKMNTILAIPLKEVYSQTYEKFVKLFPDKHIGRVGDGFRDISTDITITTFKSLPNCAIEKCELLLVDEIQSITGEKTLEEFLKIQPVRSFGFTATDQNLFNNADKVIKGMFGERLVYIPYDDALENGAVVPCVVYFVRTPEQILISSSSMEGKISQGIKNCEKRNQLIGAVCRAVPSEWQTLIFVDHVADHLVNVYKELPPGSKYLHRCSDKKELGAFALTPNQQKKIVAEYTNNEFQFLIATDAFRAGVDIPNCRVVIQAAGGTSEVEILQEAYRGSRILPDHLKEKFGVTDKTHFVLIDFMDQHDESLMNMSLKRMEVYRKQGWKIVEVDRIEDIDWNNFQKTKGL